MKEVLQQLANLQYIDSRIDEIKQLRGDLPEEILDIETDIARGESKLCKLEEEQKSLHVEHEKQILNFQANRNTEVNALNESLAWSRDENSVLHTEL